MSAPRSLEPKSLSWQAPRRALALMAAAFALFLVAIPAVVLVHQPTSGGPGGTLLGPALGSNDPGSASFAPSPASLGPAASGSSVPPESTASVAGPPGASATAPPGASVATPSSASVSPPAVSSGPAMRFGFDADSLALQHANGMRPDDATIWIGNWNLAKGWRGPAQQLETLRAANVTPVLQLYYWGDDLSQACLEHGCQGKSQAGWDELTESLLGQVNASMRGAPVVIVLESEFNKASLAHYEPLDALLAEKAVRLKTAYPAARVVLGLGGWNPSAWGTWDRAAAASDAVGVQAIAGSGHGTQMLAPRLFNQTLEGVRQLHDLFGKPIILQDVAVPSAPGPATVTTQADELTPFVANLPALKAEGVDTILYRSFVDTPNRSLGGYFGEAELNFGLAKAGTGELKPSGEKWAEAMRSEAAATGPT